MKVKIVILSKHLFAEHTTWKSTLIDLSEPDEINRSSEGLDI
jgi:hypothetical protein